MSDLVKPKSILEQGLAHAQQLALMPADTDLVVFAVKEGDDVRAGIATRLDDRWQLAGEVGVNLDTKDWSAGVYIIAKGKK